MSANHNIVESSSQMEGSKKPNGVERGREPKWECECRTLMQQDPEAKLLVRGTSFKHISGQFQQGKRFSRACIFRSTMSAYASTDLWRYADVVLILLLFSYPMHLNF